MAGAKRKLSPDKLQQATTSYNKLQQLQADLLILFTNVLFYVSSELFHSTI